MGDRDILQNLLQMRGWQNIDMGAGGNCLFLSIAPQISADELAALSSRSSTWSARLGGEVVAAWEALPVKERARLLRQIAMLDERDFVAELSGLCERGDPVPSQVHWRAMELFKDMVEEFLTTGSFLEELGASRTSPWNFQSRYDQVRQLARDTPPNEVYDFVVKHAEEYMRVTGREGNWAGSSEMAALANALERSFKAYGNNWVSQDEVELRSVGPDQWEVLPYFDAPAPADSRPMPPVRIFQTRGGGHYQMLRSG